MRLTIRRAGADDAEAVTALTRAAYARWALLIGREPLPMTMDHAAMIRDHRVDLLLVGGDLAGLVETVERCDGLLIENVAVDPSFQRQGHGRRLIAHVERLAAEMGHGRVRLYTNERFGENVRLYQSLGYNVDRLDKLNGGVVVHMSKALTTSASDAAASASPKPGPLAA